MNNIDDYILNFQNYKEGNYEYGTITSVDAASAYGPKEEKAKAVSIIK